MFGRRAIGLALAAVLTGFAAPLAAGDLADFFASFAHDVKQRNSWPEPYVYSDRAAVRQVWAIQVAAGWERENLLSDFHFLPGGKELTEAGRLRVQWIMNDVPEPHRQVYVHRAGTPQETAMRMQAVERFVAQSPYAANVPVLESTRTDDGWPADRVDWVSRKAATSALDPKLLGTSTTTSSGVGH